MSYIFKFVKINLLNYYLFFLVFIFSCSRDLVNKDYIRKLDQVSNVMIPWGPKQMDTFHLVNSWNYRFYDSENYLSNIYELTFNETSIFFDSIHRVKTGIKINLQNIEFENTSFKTLWNYPESNLKFIDTILLKFNSKSTLNYLYYSYSPIPLELQPNVNSCLGVGNLILYDSINNRWNVLNVYLHLVNDVTEYVRYFIIDDNNCITIYDFILSEGEAQTKENKYIIVKGQFKIIKK